MDKNRIFNGSKISKRVRAHEAFAVRLHRAGLHAQLIALRQSGDLDDAFAGDKFCFASLHEAAEKQAASSPHAHYFSAQFFDMIGMIQLIKRAIAGNDGVFLNRVVPRDMTPVCAGTGKHM